MAVPDYSRIAVEGVRRRAAFATDGDGIDAPSVGKVTVNIPAANASGGRILARLKACLP